MAPAERSAVEDFITFLKERNGKSPETCFQAPAEELIAAHPELLRRLAQWRSTLRFLMFSRLTCV